MSRSVKFRKASPPGSPHYEHQRSDSGVGSFSDCESRTSNPDRDSYLVPGFEDHGIYSIRKSLEQTRIERDDLRSRVKELEEILKELRNELAQAKAYAAAKANEIDIVGQEKESLTKANKELAEQNAQLQETVRELKRANRKSSSDSSPASSNATVSESSDEKKMRRSSSRRPKESSGRSDKEKERGRDRDREREKEREKEQRDRDRDRERRKEKEKERAAQEETERLRKRFDSRAEESDAKSSSASTKSQRARHDSYIEPLGHGKPRPQVPVPPSPSRQYTSYPATTAAAYPTSPAYQSIREPFGSTPRSLHPTVYVATEDYSNYGLVDDQEAYHTHPVSRSSRHPR